MTVISFVIAYLAVSKSQGESVYRKIRSDELQYYTSSINLDLPRAINIVGKRALAVAVIDIAINGTGLDDAKRRIEELMMNNTLYGQNAALMENDSLNEWADRVSSVGNSYGFTTNINFTDLSVKPYNSFSSIMIVNISIHISNNDETVNVTKNYSKEVITTYLGLDDPLYALFTNGFVSRKIFAHNETIRNVNTVDNAIYGEFYMNSSEGPSFFDRLEGKLRLSQRYKDMSQYQVGLETFVNLQELSQRGLDVRTNQSCVDYYYFNSTKITGKELSGSDNDWFKIDNYHAGVYNVTSDLIP